MTKLEALDIILHPMRPENFRGNKLVEAEKTIREALESYDKLRSKEIPMKPQIFIQDRGYDIEICPNCKGSIHALKYRHEINERGNYCDLCGQKLDWGDKND